MSAAVIAERRGGGWRPLGELLVLRGLLAEQDVENALREQRRSRRRLGQILLDRGIVSRAALESTLAEQAGQLEPERGFGAGLRGAIEVQHAGRAKDRQQDRVPLGEVLLRRGYVTDEDIARALSDQARTGRLIGEILVERGSVSEPVLAVALEEQRSGLETEGGFGSGLRAALEASHPQELV